MDIAKILDLADNLLTVVIMLGGAIAIFFRTLISEWIKNWFSKAVSKELENEKHLLDKQLEAYKVSLIREMEQYKANIDIRRSIALKMADARLEALRLFAAELSRYHNVCGSWPVYSAAHRQIAIDEWLEISESMKTAYRATEIFLSHELNLQIATYLADATNLVNQFPVTSNDSVQHSDDRIMALMLQYSQIASKLRALIFESPALLTE